MGPWHHGETVHESAAAQAERIVRGEMRKRKWHDRTLAARRKGDAVKVAIAQRLRHETTVTLAWISERLPVGTQLFRPTCGIGKAGRTNSMKLWTNRHSDPFKAPFTPSQPNVCKAGMHFTSKNWATCS